MLNNLKAFFRNRERIYRNMIFFAWMSIFLSFALGAGKIVMSLFNHSGNFLFGGIYNFGICVAKIVAVKTYAHTNGLVFKPFATIKDNCQAVPINDEDKKRIESRAYRLVGIIVMIASLAYSIGSILALFGEHINLKFGILGVLGISIITAIEIIVSVSGFIMRRREKQSLLEALKLTSLVSSLLGLYLTQTAILIYSGSKPIVYFDYVGILLGVISAFVGLYMIIKPYLRCNTWKHN